MASITISLDEGQRDRLEELARRRGQTPEEIITSWVEAMLPALEPAAQIPQVSTLDIVGAWDDVEPFGSNEEIDRVLAEESVNPHADE